MSLKPFLWFTLYKLFRLGAGAGRVQVSTGKLAVVMGVSQQSSSRRLRLLEERGLVVRQRGFGSSTIRITGDGLGRLEEVYYGLREGLEGGVGDIEFEGAIFSGMYQGGYYISQPGYRDQIRELLGFNPFPGTLNVRLVGDYRGSRLALEGWPVVILKGFQSEDRAFGGAQCYPLMVNGVVDGALIVADRSRYDLSVMEVIAPIELRKRFGLEDGDLVKLTFPMVASTPATVE
ncbi:MAG: CTP-dependent riboflavin kinase [Candidatus Bathyarchaeota archaeon]|nr:CTP-dependent riboflavin kinase [Candidatus Bathyarchaeota archaeon]MDP7443112.1 CTP-dependent riboflavin kinase [Candidatus Bathyarchaeota archaeon]